MTHTKNTSPRRSLTGALLTFALVATPVLLAAPTVADPGVGPDGQRTKMPGAMLVRGADTNDDGVITAGEWAEQLAALDANADGVVTSEEAKAHRQERMGDRPHRGRGDKSRGDKSRGDQSRGDQSRGDRFTRVFDTDGDGAVSTAELQAVYDGFDADHDAAVTAEELPTFRMHRMGRHGGPGGRLIELADTDQDGQLTRAEWTTFLGTADTNADGEIDATELRTLIESRRPVDREPPALEVENLQELFDTIDENGDGIISEDERPAPRHRGPRGGGFGRMHGG